MSEPALSEYFTSGRANADYNAGYVDWLMDKRLPNRNCYLQASNPIPLIDLDSICRTIMVTWDSPFKEGIYER